MTELDPDRLTPREALDALYRLKALLPVSAPTRLTVRSMLMFTPIPSPQAPRPPRVLGRRAAPVGAMSGAVPRDAALGAFRRHLARIQTHVQHAFEHEQHHRPAGRAPAVGALVDGVVAALFDMRADTALGEPRTAERGGDRRLWPRRAGAVQRHRPAVPDRATNRRPQTLQVVEYMLYFLWDLGLKVGHATRSIDECLIEGAADTTIRTSLLDAAPGRRRRAVRANFTSASGRLQGRRRRRVHPAKQAERAARHRRYRR